MKFIEIIGLVAGICSSASILPQIIKTIKEKKAEEVSVIMFIVMLAGEAHGSITASAKLMLPLL